MRGLIFTLILIGLLPGCAGKLEYNPPVAQRTVPNEKIINKSKEEVWKSAVANLSKNFFVINNIDKSSGLINVSYSGNPEQFINCGICSSYVSNARGERTYKFSASSPFQRYEAMVNGELFFVERKMELDGRINIIVEEVSKDKTKIIVNTKYVVNKHVFVQPVGNNMAKQSNDTISFNSNTSASFPSYGNNQPVLCIPTGKLESNILDLFD